MSIPTSLARLLADDYRRESALTRKVLRAFPAEQSSLRSHEHGNSALQLLWTFAVENDLIEGAIRDGLRGPREDRVMPPTWEQTLRRYEDGVERVQATLDGLDDAAMSRTVSFFKGPRQPAEFSLFEFVRFMIADSIHHRGQLSVYLRLAGAKVPSIYGPSFDEPWT